jgi:FtsZ-binding cell division protein ZapB
LLESQIRDLQHTISENKKQINSLEQASADAEILINKLKEENIKLKSEKEEAYKMLKILLNTGLVISKKYQS